MPPTRGHDLKHFAGLYVGQHLADAPHTGARLETARRTIKVDLPLDAPHTGARLETYKPPR